MYRKIITMTAYKRPDYTKQVIDNLKRCIGFKEYLLLPTIEPGHPEVLEAFKDLHNCDIIVNDVRLGLATNTFKALQRGFELSDFVIHLEDDTVPGIDSLKYFEWIYKTYKDDNKIFNATAYNNIKDKNKINSQNFFTVYRRPWFSCWMWATWIDRFEEMAKKWNFSTWGVNVNKRIRGNRLEICPNLSRSQNIGELQGENSSPGHWRLYQYSPIWVNNTLLPFDISRILNEDLYSEITAPADLNILDPEGDLLSLVIGLGSIAAIAYIIFRINNHVNK